jgi:protein O-GlcNAc transferase
LSHARALELLRAGRAQEGAALLEPLLRRHPADAFGWFLLGACRHALNELAPASDAFRRSLSLDPSNSDAHLAHIAVLRAIGDLPRAMAESQRAQARFAGNARIAYAAALCHEDLGRPQDALEHYDRALRLQSDLEDALHNRGLLLARLGRLQDAESSQRGYVSAYPASERAHSGLADMLLALGRFSEALDSLDRLERIAPGNLAGLVRRGVALACLRKFAEAAQLFAEAGKRDASALSSYIAQVAPGSRPDVILSPENLFFWQCHLALQRCEWSSWNECAEEMRGLRPASAAVVEPAIAFIAFHLPLSGVDRHAVARHVARSIEATAAALPPLTARRRPRLHIGILSPDFREHLNAYLLLPFFELLDRDRFELYAYSLAADDGSDVRVRLNSAADHFRDMEAMSDEQAATAIRSDDVDILIDVAGHTTGGRFTITARRPARLQVLYLGFAGSLGSTRVDYAIVDRVVAGARKEWTEETVPLPHTYYLYDFRAPVPELVLSRKAYGLPDDAFVFCAFHKAEKISPDAFELWMRVLSEAPRSVLWFLALPDAAQRNLRHAATGHGIDPARLVFAPFDPRERYLARQGLGNLMLDAIHHSAMTTACDAMATGLPVLTIKGAAMASRAGESLARAAGVPELVASDKDAYVKLAAELASNPERLAGYRRTLEARRGPLFDTAGRVREIEAALLEMWRRHIENI